MSCFSEPRDLTSQERALLDFLLRADFPGRNELQSQAQQVQAVGDCDCGCGTIDLAVSEPAAHAQTHEPIPVEAYADRNGIPIEVLLFVRGGLLAMLEIVDYTGERPLAYPTPGGLRLSVRAKPGA